MSRRSVAGVLVLIILGIAAAMVAALDAGDRGGASVLAITGLIVCFGAAVWWTDARREPGPGRVPRGRQGVVNLPEPEEPFGMDALMRGEAALGKRSLLGESGQRLLGDSGEAAARAALVHSLRDVPGAKVGFTVERGEGGVLRDRLEVEFPAGTFVVYGARLRHVWVPR